MLLYQISCKCKITKLITKIINIIGNNTDNKGLIPPYANTLKTNSNIQNRPTARITDLTILAILFFLVLSLIKIQEN